MVLPLIAAGGMALGSILVKELPSIATWMFGDKTGKVVDTVTGIAREVLGTDDPQQIEAAIARDPQAALQFKTALLQAQAESERGEREEIMAYLRDGQSAREQTMRLAEAKSPIAWGAPIISVIITAAFSVMLYVSLTRALPGAESRIVDTLMGVLSAAQMQVVNYWLGSSRGSELKNAVIAQLGARSAR